MPFDFGGIVSILADLLTILDSRRAVALWRKLSRAHRSVAWPEVLEVQAVARSTLPARLPFIGRERERAEVKAALSRNPAAFAIVGMAGVGKSALAREACHEILIEEPGSLCIWIPAGIAALRYEDVLDAALSAYGLHFAYSSDPVNKAALITDKAREWNTIFVFDSFENIDESPEVGAFVSKLAEISRVLVTTKRLLDAGGAQNAFTYAMSYIKLEPNSGAEAEDFFRALNSEFGSDRSRTLSDQQVSDIAAATGGSVLAFRWVIGQLSQGRAVGSVLGDIKRGKGGLHETMFAGIWSTLKRDQRAMLRALSLFASPPSATAIAQVAGVRDGDATARGLASLFLIDPVSERGSERFAMHPLTHSFVANIATGDARAAKRLCRRYDDYHVAFAATFGGDEWNWHKFDQIEAEIANLWATFGHLREARAHRLVLHLRDKLTLFLSIRGHWSKRIELAEAAMQSAKASGRERDYAWILVYDRAYVELKRGHIDEAERLVREGLDIFTRKRDVLGVATATRHMGRVAQSRGRFDEAQALYDESFRLYASIDSEYGAFLHWDLGDLARERGDIPGAREHFLKAFNLSQGVAGKSEAIYGMAAGALGDTAVLATDLNSAERYYEIALATATRIGRADEIAASNRRLVRLYARTNRMAQARTCAENARAVYAQLGDNVAVSDLDAVLADSHTAASIEG